MQQRPDHRLRNPRPPGVLVAPRPAASDPVKRASTPGQEGQPATGQVWRKPTQLDGRLQVSRDLPGAGRRSGDERRSVGVDRILIDHGRLEPAEPLAREVHEALQIAERYPRCRRTQPGRRIGQAVVKAGEDIFLRGQALDGGNRYW